jgi:hypothetical protein
MLLIDVAIPGVIGLVLLLWPQAMFLGSRVAPTEKKIRMLRYSGALVLLVAAVYLVIKFVSR